MRSPLRPEDYPKLFDGEDESTPKRFPVLEVVHEPDKSWPRLSEEAFCGLAGEIVKTIEPHTEADPVAVLVSLLTAFGNCVGSGPHFRVERTQHCLRLFTALVGDSAVGRKGQSWSTLGSLFSEVDPDWYRDRVTPGLSSGEGLINEVRDPRWEKKPVKDKNGKTQAYEDQMVDQGVTDKRLLVIEGEFAQVLKVMAREGNTLSPILRNAWDSGNLRVMTRTNPLRSTGAHISIIGHIVRDELLRHLNDTEQGNGFGNRFLWVAVKRSKFIPDPQGVPLNSLLSQLQQSVDCARGVGLMERDEETKTIWNGIYHRISEDKRGLLGALLARGPAQIMRLSCIYALLDESSKVTKKHLTAALALWDYCEESTKMIFGDSLGDHYADKILETLKESPSKLLSETEIWALFGRHGGPRIVAALKILQRLEKIQKMKGESTRGRPPVFWKLCERSELSERSPGEGQ